MQLKLDNLYEVVFEDTLLSGGSNPDTLKLKILLCEILLQVSQTHCSPDLLA